MLSNNLLLLDLDQTVRRCASDPAGFVNSPLDQTIIPEATHAIGLFHSAGWTCVGVTNQGGVGSGHKTLEDCIAEQRETLRLVPHLSAVLLCPDMEGQECHVVAFRDGDYVANRFTVDTIERINRELPKDKRVFIRSFHKPSCGMLLLAMRLFGNPERANCLMVGDQKSDQQAAVSAGVNFVPAAMWWHSLEVSPIEEKEAA